MHSLSGEIGRNESTATAAALAATDDLKTAGVLIHRLGDTFAHRGLVDERTTYPPGVGHGYAGTRPDQIQARPELYAEHVRSLANALSLKRNGKPLTSEEQSAIARPLLKEVFLAQSDAAKAMKNEKLERRGRAQKLRENQSPQMYWPMPTDEQLDRYPIPTNLSGANVSENIRNRYAALIERKTGRLLTLRPERWSAAITDGEGDEVANLRGLLASQDVVVDISDQELRNMAAELKAAARNAIKIVTEALDGKGQGPNHE